MRIALDAQLGVGTATGIGEYVRGLAGALRASGQDVVELREPALDPWRFDRRVAWDQLLLARRARAAGAEILHCASGTMPLYPGLPTVVTVHDVAWLRVQSHARAYARWYFGRFALARYRRAAAIAVDSAFSRSELLAVAPDLDPQHVRVVYPGVAADFCTLARRPDGGRTILAVGTVERRKNLAALIALLPRLPGARLISAGPATPYRTECERLAESLGVAARVAFRGYVERRKLLDLYASCAAVAVPSTYEGFGYAAAQALCSATPCVVSDCPALTEIAGADAVVAALGDEPAWLAALASALDGHLDERARAARAGAVARFAWPAAAAAMTEIYREAV